jgi:hypothetical protein
MNFFRRLFHRPSARIVTAFERERERALAAYVEARNRGDTRDQAARYLDLKRATSEVMRQELRRR